MKFLISLATRLLGCSLMAQPAPPESAKLLADAQKSYSSALKSQSPAMKTKVTSIAAGLEELAVLSRKLSTAIWKESTTDDAFDRHFIYRDLTTMMVGRPYPGDMSMKYTFAKLKEVEKMAETKSSDPDRKRLSPADKVSVKALIAKARACAHWFKPMSMSLSKTQQNWVGSIASGMLGSVLGEG
jgi:hypothetical protein